VSSSVNSLSGFQSPMSNVFETIRVPGFKSSSSFEDITMKAGEVLHFDAVEHDPENLGDKPFELIAVELKV